TVTWARRASPNSSDRVPVGQASFSYERVDAEIRDFSLGVMRQLDRRVTRIDFALRSRSADSLALSAVASYEMKYEADRPWFLSSITEHRGTSSKTTSYGYGRAWAEDARAPINLSLVQYGGASFVPQPQPPFPALYYPPHR